MRVQLFTLYVVIYVRKDTWIFPLLMEIIFQVVYFRGGQVQKEIVGGRTQHCFMPMSTVMSSDDLNWCHFGCVD